MDWFEGTTTGPNAKHSESSVRPQKSYLRIHILPELGHVKLADLGPMIPDFIEKLKLNLAGGTVGEIYGTICAICEYARKRMGFPFNPLDGVHVDLPEKRSRSVEEVPKFEDMHSILIYLDRPKPEAERLLNWLQSAVIIGLCGLAGLRRGEIAGIDAEHIDLDRFWIRVDQQLKENGKIGLPKYRKKRGLPIDPCLHRILLRYREFLGKWSGPLFLDLDGKRKSAAWVASIVETLMKKVGLVNDIGENKYSTHGFRHFAGSAWIASKVAIDRVSKYLGHGSTAFTEKVYIHELERRDRDHEALRSMADMFPDLGQSVIPDYAKVQPAPLPPVASGPRLVIADGGEVIAAEAIPDIEIPAHAAQWIPYAVRLLQAGWELEDVRKEVGYAERNFQWAFNRIGLTPSKIRRDAQRERARHLYRNGLNRNQIAKIIEVDWVSANRWTRNGTE